MMHIFVYCCMGNNSCMDHGLSIACMSPDVHVSYTVHGKLLLLYNVMHAWRASNSKNCTRSCVGHKLRLAPSLQKKWITISISNRAQYF